MDTDNHPAFRVYPAMSAFCLRVPEAVHPTVLDPRRKISLAPQPRNGEFGPGNSPSDAAKENADLEPLHGKQERMQPRASGNTRPKILGQP